MEIDPVIYKKEDESCYWINWSFLQSSFIYFYGIGKNYWFLFRSKIFYSHVVESRIDWSINSLQVARQPLSIRLIHSLSSIEFSTLKKHKFPLFSTFFPRDFHTILSRVDDKGCNNDTQLKITGSMPMFAHIYRCTRVRIARLFNGVFSPLSSPYRRN